MPNRLNEHREKIEAELCGVLEELKGYSLDQLEELAEPRIIRQICLDGRDYKMEAWREPIADRIDGKFVVLVDAWIKRPFSSHRILRGLVVRSDGSVVEISDSDMWRYD